MTLVGDNWEETEANIGQKIIPSEGQYLQISEADLSLKGPNIELTLRGFILENPLFSKPYFLSSSEVNLL